MPKWQWMLERLRSRLWLRASFFCIAGVVTALFGYVVKGYIPPDIAQDIGAESVVAILHILANSMLVVTVFSLSTMVTAYAGASSSATPRATVLLMEDRTSQNALSTFIGAFLYSLVGIIALNMGLYGQSGRLVLLAMTLGVIIIIIATLLQWIDYLSRFGRVGDTIDMVEKATTKSLKTRLETPYLGGQPLKAYKPATGHHPVRHPTIGYIQHIDMAQLADIAKRNNAEMFLDDIPGHFNDSVRPILHCSRTLSAEEEDLVRKAYSIGDSRTFDQDPRYGMVVLSEIATRALSPAVNDLGTAIDVIGTAVRLLAPWVAPRTEENELLYPRIYVPSITTDELFHDIFAPIAREGAGISEVGVRLQKALSALAALGDGACRGVAAAHSGRAHRRAFDALTTQEDKDLLARHVLAPVAGKA